MSDKLNYWLAIAGAGVIGSGVTAVGNAFGFSRRLKKVEDSVEKCYTKKEQDRNCRDAIALINNNVDHHTKAIDELKAEQKAGFEGVYQRLNKLIDAAKKG